MRGGGGGGRGGGGEGGGGGGSRSPGSTPVPLMLSRAIWWPHPLTIDKRVNRIGNTR